MPRKRKDNNVLVYVLIAAAVVVAAFSIYALAGGNNYYGSSYQKAMSAQNPSDICATPEGYTDESWRQHMSHHPDQYAECFK